MPTDPIAAAVNAPARRQRPPEVIAVMRDVDTESCKKEPPRSTGVWMATQAQGAQHKLAAAFRQELRLKCPRFASPAAEEGTET